MEGIAVQYFTNPIYPSINEEKYEFHSNISAENEQDACDSHACMFHLLKIYLNQEYQFLVYQQYGKTPMVVPSNIGVLWLYM